MGLSRAARAALAPLIADFNAQSPRGGRLEMSWYEDIRPRWLAGCCPCCAGCIDDWEWQGQVHDPEPIGEGVILCGRCIANRHHSDPPVNRLLLLAALLP